MFFASATLRTASQLTKSSMSLVASQVSFSVPASIAPSASPTTPVTTFTSLSTTQHLRVDLAKTSVALTSLSVAPIALSSPQVQVCADVAKALATASTTTTSVEGEHSNIMLLAGAAAATTLVIQSSNDVALCDDDEDRETKRAKTSTALVPKVPWYEYFTDEVQEDYSRTFKTALESETTESGKRRALIRAMNIASNDLREREQAALEQAKVKWAEEIDISNVNNGALVEAKPQMDAVAYDRIEKALVTKDWSEVAPIVDNSRASGRNGLSSVDYRNSMLNVRAIASQAKKFGNMGFDRKLFLTCQKYEGILTLLVKGKPGAPEPICNDAFMLFKTDSEDENQAKLLGNHANIKEFIAAEVGHASWKAMQYDHLNEKKSGWVQNPKTKLTGGPPRKGAVPNSLLPVLYHKKGCNFGSDGPGQYDNGTFSADYYKKRTKKRKGNYAAEEDSKPAASTSARALRYKERYN